MAQIHLVICIDTELNSIDVDWGTTIARFQEEPVFDYTTEGWRELSGEEDNLVDDLLPYIDNALKGIVFG